jgi:hypothetical protein
VRRQSYRSVRPCALDFFISQIRLSLTEEID